VGAVAGTVTAPAVAAGVVGLIGFGPGGVVAGSLAAAIHSCIGNVAAGSLFATAQAIGAGAALPFLGFAGAAVAGAVIAGRAVHNAINAPTIQNNICPVCNGIIPDNNGQN